MSLSSRIAVACGLTEKEAAQLAAGVPVGVLAKIEAGLLGKVAGPWQEAGDADYDAWTRRHRVGYGPGHRIRLCVGSGDPAVVVGKRGRPRAPKMQDYVLGDEEEYAADYAAWEADGADVAARPWSWSPFPGTKDGGTAETMQSAAWAADTWARDAGWILLGGPLFSEDLY